jgi:hypothetical protein
MASEAHNQIWSTSLEDAKRAHLLLEGDLFARFKAGVDAVLPTLF